jgi:cytochrome c oxidase assembly factor CtaG
VSGPYSFHLHLVAWLAIAAAGLTYAGAARREGRLSPPGTVPTRRQWWCLGGGLLALVLALTWPVADLAAHWSLTALLVQRLLLILAAAPLLLSALPAPFIAAVTRPAPVDRALEVLTRPVVAVVVFTVIAVGTLLPPAVAAQASSGVVRGVVDVVLLFGGFILWGPVLHNIPGASRPTAVGLAAYLFIQSVIPGFPSVIYVFSHHPLYDVFAHAHAAIGLSAVGDQQLAGVVAKVATLPVLWTVAWVALSRAARQDATGSDPAVLTWTEVERQLQRAERRQNRPPRHPRSVSPIPRPGQWRASETEPGSGATPDGPPTPGPSASDRPGDPADPS